MSLPLISPAVIHFRGDDRGQWQQVNAAWSAITGSPIEESLALGWQDWIHPLDRPRVVAAWQESLQTHQELHISYDLLTATGHHQKVLHTAAYLGTGVDWVGSLHLQPQTPLERDPGLLDLVFAQSLDGLFVMLLDQPVRWDNTVDKEAVLDYVFDHQRMIRVNTAMAAQYGSSIPDFLGLTPKDLFAHNLDYGRKIWRDFFDAGHLTLETEEAKRDGTPMTIAGEYTCIYDSEGRILGHIGCQREITAKKKLARTLIQQQHLLQNILTATPNAVYIYDFLENRTIFANDRVTDLLGLTPDDIQNQGSQLLQQYIHPEDQERVNRHLQECLSLPDNASAAIEYRFRKQDRWIWLQSREDVFSRTSQGTVKQILGVLQDISDRKDAENQLRRSQQHFQTLVEHSPDIIVRFDINLVLTYVSPAVESALGIPPNQILGLTPHQLGNAIFAVPSPAIVHFEEGLNTVLMTGHQQRIEVDLKTPLGTKTLEILIVAERDEDGSIASALCLGRDVTEYHFLLEKLTASEQKLTNLIRNLPGFVYTFSNDRDYTALWVSEGIEILTEYPPEAFIARHITFGQLMDPADRDRIWDDIQYALEHQQSYEFEYRLQTRSGQRRWLWERGRGVYDQENNLLYTQGFITDITSRKQIELTLEKQVAREQALNRITQAIRDSFDLEHIFTKATQEVIRNFPSLSCYILRYDPDLSCWTMINQARNKGSHNLSGMIISDHDNLIFDPIKKGVTIEHHPKLIDFTNEKLTFPFSDNWLMAPIRVGGVTWGCLTLVFDPMILQLSEDRAFAQAIAGQLAIAIQQAELYNRLQRFNQNLASQVDQQTQELREILNYESILQMIIEQVRNSLDEQEILDGVVQALGRQLALGFCNITTYHHQTPQVRSFYSLEDQCKDRLILAVDDYGWLYENLRQGQSCSLTIFCQDRQQWVAVFVAPIVCDDETIGDVLVLRNSQDSFSQAEIRLVEHVANQCAIALRQSRLYRAVQVQVEELQRLNHLKDDFLSTVSHELRTPLTSMKLATRMLSLHLQSQALPPQVSHYLQILETEGNREINLINDLLDLSRLEASHKVIQLCPVDGVAVIQRMVSPLQARLEAQQQTLIVLADPGLPPVDTDPAYLERILGELLHNAIKYTPAGEQIRISCHTQSTYQIQISNTGVELPATEWERIFEKFYRVPHNDPWKHGGTGLGLALVKKMVLALGGDIQVTSEPRQTTFTLSFPLTPPIR